MPDWLSESVDICYSYFQLKQPRSLAEEIASRLNWTIVEPAIELSKSLGATADYQKAFGDINVRVILSHGNASRSHLRHCSIKSRGEDFETFNAYEALDALYQFQGAHTKSWLKPAQCEGCDNQFVGSYMWQLDGRSFVTSSQGILIETVSISMSSLETYEGYPK